MVKRRPVPVVCPICETTVSRKNDLARHMNLHNPHKEQMKHACPHPGCTYKTLQRSNLKTHMNKHTGECPFQCEETGCDFATGDPASLTRHRKNLHGYRTKENSRSRLKSVSRKETRRQRRPAPYPLASIASTGQFSVSSSPLDSCLELFGTPSPETCYILDSTASLSLPVSSSAGGQEIKNTFAAYNTQLIPGFAQAHNASIGLDDRTPEHFSSHSDLITETEMRAEGYFLSPQLESIPQEGPSDFGLPTDLSPDVNTDTLFENFLSQFDYAQEMVSSAPPYVTPIEQNRSNLLEPPLMFLDVPYSKNDNHPIPAVHPDPYAITGTYYGHYNCCIGAASFDAQGSLPWLFGAVPDVATYPKTFYPRSVDQVVDHDSSAPADITNL